MNDQGWIKLHRQLKETSFYKRSAVVHLFVHLLLTANREDKKFYWNGKEEVIRKGELLTGRKELSRQTGISQQSIRTATTILKSTSTITTRVTNKFTVFTILKWEDYQGLPTSTSTNGLTNNQPTTNQQLTTNKNNKNERNIINNTLPSLSLFDKTIHYLEKLPQPDCKYFVKSFNLGYNQLMQKCKDLADYCRMHKKGYHDPQAFLRNAIRRDFGERKELQISEKQGLSDLVLNTV